MQIGLGGKSLSKRFYAVAASRSPSLMFHSVVSTLGSVQFTSTSETRILRREMALMLFARFLTVRSLFSRNTKRALLTERHDR